MIRILVGDALTRLRELPSNFVHCVATSPPYWGLRDYGTGQWEGGSAGCDHKPSSTPARRRLASSMLEGGQSSNGHQQEGYRDTCAKCGARRVDQQIGLEDSPDLYVARLVEVFREVKRVLRKDGVLWINMGDSYSSGGGTQVIQTKDASHGLDGMRQQTPWIAPKQLLGIPWKLAFALQADGWWLRSEIIWHKPNCMPESVTDRPTKSHEQIFLLTKSANYYYDNVAVMEESTDEEYRTVGKIRPNQDAYFVEDPERGRTRSGLINQHGGRTTRNRRSVWTIPTSPFSEAHFATFPPDLVEPMIKAGTSERGCCSVCGAPWERVIEKTGHINNREPAHVPGNTSTKVDSTGWKPTTRPTDNWAATCTCGADARPCAVLDPFAGSGTALMVADRLGRDAIGIELNADYVSMAEKRIRDDAGMFADIRVEKG